MTANTVTEILTASQVSAYAWQFQRHIVDSLASLVGTVRLEKELGTEFIGVYQNKVLKAAWCLSGDQDGTWYELARPDDIISYNYAKKILSAL